MLTYTDGVTQAINASQACFTRDRLLKSLEAHRQADLGNLVQGVHNDMQAYTGAEPQIGEITLAAVRFNAPGVRSKTGASTAVA